MKDHGQRSTARTALKRLERDYWEWQLREYPELSTWTGDNRYNDRFTDLSMDAIEKRKADERRLLAEVQKIDHTRLSDQDQVSHSLLLWELEMAVKAQQFPSVMLLNQIFGPQLMLPQLMSVTPFANRDDYENYLGRLDRFPRYLEQVIDVLTLGIELGWVQPNGPLRSVPDQIQGQLTPDIEKNILFSPLLRAPGAIPDAERERLQATAKAIIADAVYPALSRLKDFITERYLPAGDRPIAATTLPGGEPYYDHSILEYTTVHLSAEEIRRIGLEEVARIDQEIDKVMEQAGFKGSLSDFASFLCTDPRFYFTKPEDLLRAYRDIAKRVDAELPRLFQELPRTPYGVRAFPDHEAPSQTTAQYYPGAFDGSRAGYFMVNTYRLDTRPTYEMETLTLHEAVPGHHLQIARAQELTHLPQFRRNASYNAYIEGWALYAESLGYELGFYTDPYSRFGRLTNEMWRACRLVVDTGLHRFGWTRQQAIDYIVEHTAKMEHDVGVEVDRYIVWPGQALSYKIGELKIKGLRAKAEAELGSSFNVRKFHNQILDSGPLPITVLQGRIEKWIENQKASS